MPEVGQIHETLTELEGHFAYVQGATDSGVRDHARRAELASRLDGFDETDLRVGISTWLREHLLSDDAIAEGYGWEDVLEFCRWIADGDYRPNPAIPLLAQLVREEYPDGLTLAEIAATWLTPPPTEAELAALARVEHANRDT